MFAFSDTAKTKVSVYIWFGVEHLRTQIVITRTGTFLVASFAVCSTHWLSSKFVLGQPTV